MSISEDQRTYIAAIQSEIDDHGKAEIRQFELDILLGQRNKHSNMKLAKLFEAIHESIETSTAQEIKDACELIIRVQSMSGGEIDTIVCAFEKGPLFDGDVPSKSARNQLVVDGLMAHVVVKGEDGYNACTHSGAWAYRLIRASGRG